MTLAQTQLRLAAYQKILPRSPPKLRRLTYFNKAYAVMTTNLVVIIEARKIEDTRAVERLLVDFAERYFDAIAAGLDAKPMPTVWQRAAWRIPWPPYVNILLGAYAHIIYDLPESLLTTIKDPLKFKRDFDTINDTVLSSAIDVMQDLAVNHSLVRFLYRHPSLYEQPLSMILTMWRDRAWRNYSVRISR